jgi:tetratricopeptide (TPR) repeat protein
MDVLRAAYAIDPLNPTLLFNLAVRDSFSGRHEPAARYAAELQDVRPDWDGTYRLKSQLARIQGERVDELRWARKALELDPDNVGTLMQIADRYLDFGNWDKARDYADRAREVNPLAGDAIAMQADYRFYNGDADGAWGLINRTIDKIPTDPDLLYQAGRMALKEDRTGDALRYFERVIPPDQDGNGWAMESIDRAFRADLQVLAYRQAGRPDDARGLRRQCGELMDSLDADATWAVPYLRAGLAAAAGDRDEMLGQLRVAVAANARRSVR